jgi:hypothetical protein
VGPEQSRLLAMTANSGAATCPILSGEGVTEFLPESWASIDSPGNDSLGAIQYRVHDSPARLRQVTQESAAGIPLDALFVSFFVPTGSGFPARHAVATHPTASVRGAASPVNRTNRSSR